MESSVIEYENKYKNGYGLQYPDGHIIRIKYQYLTDEDLFNKNLLDFGGGNGIHSEYLHKELNVIPHCVDTSTLSISESKKRLNNFSENMIVIKPSQNIYELFQNKKFNLILANQSLYYLNTSNIKNYIEQFSDLLNDNGIIIATFMGKKNYYFNLSEKTEDDNLRKVILKGRLNETTYINFLEENDILDLFKDFKKISFGYYDHIINDKEGSNFHYIYIGRKI